MDNGFISEPTYACCSPVPHFFITSMFGEPGKWATRFNFLSYIGKENELARFASDATWRKKEQRTFISLCKNLGREDNKDVPLLHGFDFKDLKSEFDRRNEWAGNSVTAWWLQLVVVAENIKKECPNTPIADLYMFLTTLKNRKFDHEEMLMWMLCAYLEWIFLDRICNEKSNGNGDNTLDFVHVSYWKPISELNKLCTTRYRVLNDYLTKHNDRNYRHLIGPRLHDSSSANKYRKLSVRNSLVALEANRKSQQIKSVFLEREQYRTLLYFMSYFELMQLDMLAKNIPAIRIEMSFSRIDEIQRKFQYELNLYMKEHAV